MSEVHRRIRSVEASGLAIGPSCAAAMTGERQRPRAGALSRWVRPGRSLARAASPVLATTSLLACFAAPSAGAAAASPSTAGWGIPQSYLGLINSPKLNDLNTTSTCHAGATQLTYWSWVEGINRSVNLYNLTHSNVCIDWVNIAGSNSQTKETAALSTGSGAPDIMQIQDSNFSNFLATAGDKFVNLAQYGAMSLKSAYPAWAWDQFDYGGKVYSIPQDSGPMGIMYNATLFAKYHLSVPTTWAQFATEAAQLHKAHPTEYLLNLPPYYTLQTLFWAQSTTPPTIWQGGRAITIDYDTPSAKQAADYWQKLFAGGDLYNNQNSNAIFKADASGQILAQLAEPYSPSFFESLAGKTVGQWRVALLPQWVAGQDLQVNDGGADVAVTVYSHHKADAAAFDFWLNSSEASWYLLSGNPSYLFPTPLRVLSDKSYLSQTIPLTGGQQVWKVFASMAEHVNHKYQQSPLNPETGTVFEDEFDKVLQGKGTFLQAVQASQSQTVQAAKQDGFSVST